MEAIIDKTIEEFTEDENVQEITVQNGNEEAPKEIVFKNNRSFGYYTIPFTINKHKYSAFKKRINTIISHSERDILSDSERFKSCRYVFSYIKEIYKTNDFYKIDSDALTREMNCPDVLDRLFPFSDKKSGKRFPSTLEEISILVFGKSKGYLMFKVCYNDMSLRDIEIFSYYFRHIVNSTENNCTFAQICAFILGVEKYETFRVGATLAVVPGPRHA